MLQVDTLIRTKLRPPFTRSDLVLRQRLQEQIERGLRGPLTLIAAPAGFGKTTLVASSIASCGLPVAWLSLDKHDNQAERFLNYLIAALHGADNQIGNEAAQLVTGMPPAPSDAVLTSLVNDLDIANTEMALVLDDYQFMSNRAVHEAVAFLLEHCPRTFHLVIATRSDPPLPLARLRARGQMIELRASDLRFTESEAAQFLNNVMNLRLDAGLVAALGERTEGWITGLQMAGLVLQGTLSTQGCEDVAAFIAGFSGTNRYILDYLLAEVLAREPEAVQTFLLQTALLARLSGALCDAVTGTSDGQAMLEMLEQRNLFVVPLDNDRCWYRYHHLFADLLQARLHQSGSEQVAKLLSRAAAWCEQNGYIAEAIDYALAAQDDQRAADLIARYWHHTANRGEIETVWSWLEALPQDVVRNSALLGLAYCWVLWLKGQIGAIEPHLADAERALRGLESSTDDAKKAALPAHFAALRSIIARYSNDCESAVASAEHALHLAPENLPPQDNAQLRTVVFMALASAYEGASDLEEAVSAYTETIRWSRLGANAAGVTGMTHWLIGLLWLLGRLRAADEACQEALNYLQERGMARLPAAGIMHLRMSEILLERNDLEAADAHMARAIELGKWSGRFDAALNAAPVLVRLRLARGDVSGALAAVREAESVLDESASPLAKGGLLALRANILLRQGALVEAARCVEEAVRLAGQDRGQTGEKVALAASKLRIAQGDRGVRSEPGETLAELAQFLSAAEASGRFGVVLELRILRSLVLARQGDIQEAKADLERALDLAAPEGYVRIFVDVGPPMQMLLVQWLAHADKGPLRDYASHLLVHFDAEPQMVDAVKENIARTGGLIEPLSQRELEVLRLIALGKTNKEIAQQLFVAPGTIKAHTSSIYRKLDVANRTEAAARARQLGLL